METTGRKLRGPGPALLALGLLACLRAAWVSRPLPDPAAWGERIPLRLETLQGEEFRLLPGVGPKLAERLEQARLAAGGALVPGAVEQVAGVGRSLRLRWEAVRPPSSPGRGLR